MIFLALIDALTESEEDGTIKIKVKIRSEIDEELEEEE